MSFKVKLWSSCGEYGSLSSFELAILNEDELVTVWNDVELGMGGVLDIVVVPFQVTFLSILLETAG